jgi:transcription initiation factor TFIIIB Brf1 subunit/transcription initiation factor TFIIB
MMDELKPCPFCGCQKIETDPEWGIYCTDCGWGFSYEYMDSQEEINAVPGQWNTRPIEDELRALNVKAHRIISLALKVIENSSPRHMTGEYMNTISELNREFEGWMEDEHG